jgi:hypothetical protein
MEKIFSDEDLPIGRIISYSKSRYREEFPENEVYFNANIFALDEGKIWYGDLDLTKDKEILERMATRFGKDLFILRELDGRFENDNLKDSEIIRRAVSKINK